MGGRGVAGQWFSAAPSASARARGTICRLVLVGAFCLVGWVVLAVGDASSAAASEHPAGDRKLGGGVRDAARNTAEQVTADAKALRPDQQESAGSATDSTAGRDLSKTVAHTADELATPLDPELPDAAGSGWADGLVPHEPEPESPGASGHGGGSGGDSGASLPVPGASMPAAVAGTTRSPVKDLLYERPGNGADAPVLLLRNAATSQPKDRPGWPAVDHPVSPPAGSSAGWSAGAGHAPVAVASMPVPVAGADPPRAIAAGTDEPVPANDAVKPPVSPD